MEDLRRKEAELADRNVEEERIIQRFFVRRPHVSIMSDTS